MSVHAQQGIDSLRALLDTASGTARFELLLAASEESAHPPTAASALEWSREAEELAKEYPGTDFSCRARLAVGRSLFFAAEYTKAIDYLNTSITLCGGDENSLLYGNYMFWHAWSHVQVAQLDSGEVLFERSLRIA